VLILEGVLSNIFTTFVWPSWLKSAAYARCPDVWRRVFIKAAEESGTLSPNLACELAQTPSMTRLMINCFRPDRSIPSAQLFAISAAFEMLQRDFEFSSRSSLQPWEVRNFASTVRREWLNTLNEKPLLRSRFKNVRDVIPAHFIGNDAKCMPNLDSLLIDETQLRKEFFRSFSSPDATEEVVIWLPDKDGIVHHSPDKRITLTDDLNASLGFFRTGHEYSLHDTADKVQWLQLACRDSRRGLETGQFGDRSIGSITNHNLWAK